MKKAKVTTLNVIPKRHYGGLETDVKMGMMSAKTAIYHGVEILCRNLNSIGFLSFAKWFKRMLNHVDWDDPKTVATGTGLYWKSLDDCLNYIDVETGHLLEIASWFKRHIHDDEAKFEQSASAKAAEVEMAMKQVDPGADEFVGPGNPTGANQYTDGIRSNTVCSTKKRDDTSKPGILRRLARAASGQKSRGVVPTPERRAQCQELLRKYAAGELSAHQAAIAAGLRKVKSPLDAALSAYRRLSVEERAMVRIEQDRIDAGEVS